MLITTTHNLPNYEVIMISTFASQHVEGTNSWFDRIANWVDVWGGRSGKYEKLLKRCTDAVVADLMEQAEIENPSINALLGLTITPFPINGTRLIAIQALATAAIVTPIEKS